MEKRKKKKEACNARTRWYYWQFHLIYWYQIKKTKGVNFSPEQTQMLSISSPIHPCAPAFPWSDLPSLINDLIQNAGLLHLLHLLHLMKILLPPASHINAQSTSFPLLWWPSPVNQTGMKVSSLEVVIMQNSNFLTFAKESPLSFFFLQTASKLHSLVNNSLHRLARSMQVKNV